jgi:hypothetical protein
MVSRVVPAISRYYPRSSFSKKHSKAKRQLLPATLSFANVRHYAGKVNLQLKLKLRCLAPAAAHFNVMAIFALADHRRVARQHAHGLKIETKTSSMFKYLINNVSLATLICFLI